MDITAATRQDIIELVVTALDAAPGTTLLNELVAIVDGGGTLADVAANLAASDTFTARYPAFQTAEEFAAEWLGNLIPEAGADAMAEAKALVVAAVNGGTTAASLLLQAQEFLSAASETDAAFGTSAANFNNKAEVASHYTLTNETAALGTATLADVTSDDATVTSAKASLDAAPAAAAEAFSLTKGLDSKTTGAGDDTFNSANTATVTLNSGDILDGGEGTDTLSVSNTVAAATLGTGVTTSNIEGLSINAVANTTVDTSLMTGITDVYNNGSLGTVSVSNLKAIPNVHLTSAAADTTVGFASAATVAGTADAMTVALNAASVTSSANLTANGIETFNVIASGNSGSATNSQTLTSSTARSVATTGDASTNITVNLAGAGATAATAGSYTGNDATNRVNLTADAADILTVDLKGGDDTYTASSIGAKHTLTGGDGTDTLKLTQAVASAASTKATVSGWETLNVSDAGTGTIDMDAFSGVSKVVYDAGLGGATTVDDAVTGLEVEVDVTAAANNLTVDLKADGAADALTVTIDAIGAGDAIGVIDASDAETLTIAVDDDTLTATGTLAITSITLGDATTVNVSGDAATTISGATNPTTTVLGLFDASGMTDNITVSGVNLKAAGGTVKLGAGDDSWTVGTADGADTYDISAGGKDTITYTAVAQSDAAGMDTIIGFTSGSDDIDLTALGVTTTTLFGGVGANKTAAEAILAGATAPTTVFQADDNILWVDSSNDNQLGAGDFRVLLSGVTTIAATDLGLAASGATSTLSAASAVVNTTTKTNASAVTTNEGDTIKSTAAQIVGSTIDGAQGADTLQITSGTAAVDLSAAAGTIANVETVETLSAVSTLTIAAADTGKATGSISTITGLASATQTLAIAASDDLTDVTIRNFSTFSDGGANAAATYTMDADNMTDLSAITISGGTADTLELADGTYDLSNIALTGTAASTLDLNADGNAAKTVTADAADLAMFAAGSITGETTASIITTLNVNDTDDLSSATVTNVDTITIGTSGNTNQTLTLSGADFVASNFTTVTGSGDDNLTIGDDVATDFTNTTISGIDTLDVSAASTNRNISLDSASISGSVTIVAAANANLLLTEDMDVTALTITAGDFDSAVLSEAADITADESIVAAGSSIASIVGTNGGVTETMTITMSAAGTLDLDALATVTDMTLTVVGSSGADTIDASGAGADYDAAYDNMVINLGASGGADTVLLENHTHTGTNATGITIQNFTGGITAEADKLSFLNTGDSTGGGWLTITAAATNIADVDLMVVEIASSVNTVTDFTAVGAGGAVELAIANAIGQDVANNSGAAVHTTVILYGAGAQAGNAAVYEVESTTAATTDLTAANITVELIATLTGVTADSLVQSNFI